MHTDELKAMPNPSEKQQDSPEFEAVWSAIKSWDINVPESYEGYCGANGSYVAIILDALDGPTSIRVNAGAPRTDAWARELAHRVAGAALGIALQDHPDYVMPSEKAIEEVQRVLDEFGIYDGSPSRPDA